MYMYIYIYIYIYIYVYICVHAYTVYSTMKHPDKISDLFTNFFLLMC